MWKKISSFPLRGVKESLQDHLRLVIASVELLNDLIVACAKDDWQLVIEVAERIAMLEREADDVKRKAELNLYRGAIFIGLKEDYLTLAETVDSISDRAKEASRALATREPEKREIDLLFECKTDIKMMISGTVDIVKLLEQSISLLNTDVNEALKKAHEVEKMEEMLDEQKLDLIKHLTTNEKNLSTLTYLQIRDFIFLLDMVADAAEEASDVLTAMIVKSGA